MEKKKPTVVDLKDANVVVIAPAPASVELPKDVADIIRKSAKGDYTYDTTASVTYDGDPETLEQTMITLLRDADIIARNEINQRLRIDGGGSRE